MGVKFRTRKRSKSKQGQTVETVIDSLKILNDTEHIEIDETYDLNELIRTTARSVLEGRDSNTLIVVDAAYGREGVVVLLKDGKAAFTRIPDPLDYLFRGEDFIREVSDRVRSTFESL